MTFLLIYGHTALKLKINYVPYYGDEIFYYKNSESFTKTLSLQSIFTYTGKGAKILGADAHGPFYPIFYGILSKLIGWHDLNIPLINLATLLLSILFLFYQENLNSKLMALIVLGNPITLFYSISFMPELLHISGSIIIYISLKKYLQNQSHQSLLFFILTIFYLSLLRNTWFFALYGILILPIPIKKTYKILIPVTGTIFSFLLQKYFHETVPNTFSEVISLMQGWKIKESFEIVYTNVKRNIYFIFNYSEGKFYTMQKIWWLITIGLSIYFIKKSKILYFGIISFGIVFLFNIILYKNYSWVDLRLYTPLILLLNLSLIDSIKIRAMKTTLVLFNTISLILILPLHFKITENRIKQNPIDFTGNFIKSLQYLPKGTFYVSPEILDGYNIVRLPIQNCKGENMTYILPYYISNFPKIKYSIEVETNKDQLKVPVIKILNQ